MTREALIAGLRESIGDERVLGALARVPRERFVRAVDRPRAWDDRALPIESGQTISQPFVVARMCEALNVGPGDRVLEVGTGSGYHAAVLAALGATVWSVERHEPLANAARATLAGAGVRDVTVVVGDGSLGWPPEAPYDAVSVTATASGDVPPALVAQLAPGGRLIAPVASGGAERLVLLRRDAGGRIARTELEPVRFVPLVRGEPA